MISWECFEIAPPKTLDYIITRMQSYSLFRTKKAIIDIFLEALRKETVF